MNTCKSIENIALKEINCSELTAIKGGSAVALAALVVGSIKLALELSYSIGYAIGYSEGSN